MTLSTPIWPGTTRHGWIGPYIYDEQYWCDVHVGDAILINPMLRFAEVVLANDELKEIRGQRAQRYVQLTQRELIEKWDERGTWHDDGPQGSYRAWDHYLAPNDLSTWHHSTDPKAGLSLPFNKQMDLGWPPCGSIASRAKNAIASAPNAFSSSLSRGCGSLTAVMYGTTGNPWAHGILTAKNGAFATIRRARWPLSQKPIIRASSLRARTLSASSTRT